MDETPWGTTPALERTGFESSSVDPSLLVKFMGKKGGKEGGEGAPIKFKQGLMRGLIRAYLGSLPLPSLPPP